MAWTATRLPVVLSLCLLWPALLTDESFALNACDKPATSTFTTLSHPERQARMADVMDQLHERWKKYPPGRHVLAFECLGECSISILTQASPEERDAHLTELLRHRKEKRPGPYPSLETIKLHWALLEDGTCVYSDNADQWGKPYARGRLGDQDVAAFKDRVRSLSAIANKPGFRYPTPVCVTFIGMVEVKARLGDEVILLDVPVPDLRAALDSKPYAGFPLDEEQARFLELYADLIRTLHAARGTSFTAAAVVPESCRIHTIPLPLPGE